MMHPMKCTHTLPRLRISRSPSDFSLFFWDPNLLGALHVGNDLLWHPNAFWPHCWLACSPWWPPPCHFSSSSRDKVWRPFVHLVGVSVGELAWFLFIFLFLLISSPILHLELIGLVAFLVAHVANHSLSFIKLLHSLILMKLALLRLAFHLSQALGEASHFLLELLILHCDLLCACFYNNFININLVTQGWV